VSVNNFTHVCGLCGETWIGAHVCSKRATNVPFRVARLPRALDAASYRAGLEAAAKLFEDQAKLSTDAAWSEQLCEMAGEIRALPTPSTLPEDGGEQ